MSDYPYAERFPVNRGLPESGRPRADVLAELGAMAAEEDAFWETGQGLRDDVLRRPRALRVPHRGVRQVRPRQRAAARHVPLGHPLRGRGHRDGARPDARRGGHRRGAGRDGHHRRHRQHPARAAGLPRPRRGHPRHHPAQLRQARDRPPGVRQGLPPVRHRVPHGAGRPRHHAGRPRADGRGDRRRTPSRSWARPATTPTARSTRSPSSARWPWSAGSACTSTAAWAASSCPFGEELGYDVPPFDFRVPGVTSISADTHKYGYAFKGSSVLLFRDKAVRNAQYFHIVGWSGGKYMSPGMEGSRSGGLLAATWASMVHLGREGYREYAARHLRDRRRDDGRRPLATRSCGSWAARRSASPSPPTTFDIYHVADFMRLRGWRFNGQQYPNAIHMAVTRPQTQPGVVDAFAADLAEAVDVRQRASRRPASTAESGAIYGGVAGGLTSEVEDFIVMFMDAMLDAQQAPAARGGGRSDRAWSSPSTWAAAVPRSATSRSPARSGWWWYERADAVAGAEVAGRRGLVAARSSRPPGAAWPRAGVDGARRWSGVAVTGQWASTVPVDAHGLPVGECLMWSDTRGGGVLRRALRRAGRRATRRARWPPGCAGPAASPTPPARTRSRHMLHLERDRPEVTARARWYLEPVDYLTMRFTGVAAATPMSMTAAWLTDNRDLARLAYDPVLVRMAGVEPRPAAAARAAAAPSSGTVLPGGGRADRDPRRRAGRDRRAGPAQRRDRRRAASGCSSAHISLGTSAWISCPVPRKKTDVIRQMAVGAGDRRRHTTCWPTTRTTPAAAWSGSARASRRRRRTTTSRRSPPRRQPGAGSVLFTPWLSGERSPFDDRHARGGFHNVSLDDRPRPT